ncbi:hypothetical protein ACUXOC_000228 [Corynebacterium mucifaciens]
MLKAMNLTQWIEQVTGGATPQEIAKAAKLPVRTVQHQLSTGRMSLENKILIGVAYRHHPMRTLVEWEVVNPEWASVPDIEAALRLAGEEQLADEVLWRMLRGKNDAFDVTVDELAAKRDRSNTRRTDVEPAPYAANRRKPEPEEGDDDYGPGA